MSWEEDMTRFTVKLDGLTPALVPRLASALYESIVEGSPVTGSPGQPVGQYGPGYHPGEVGGDLRTSWQVTFPAEDTAAIVTKSLHAEQNEDGIARPSGGPYRQRSTVGGRHSVALTRMGAQRLLDRIASEGLRPEGFEGNFVLNQGATHT